MGDLRIGIIGAGIIGLTTALELQKEFRNAEINVIAEDFFEKTTSYVAAGIFRPGTAFSGPTEEITNKWIRNSYHYWEAIVRSNSTNVAGITEIGGYIFSTEHPHIVRNKYLEGLVPVYRRACADEFTLCNGQFKYGSYFRTLLIECEFTLPWMCANFTRNGGKVMRKRITSLRELTGKYDVAVNCSGFGAKYLCNDHKLVPIRGQIIKVRAPWLDSFFYADYDTYIIPGLRAVTLGGCKQYDSYSLTVNGYDSQAIRERCINLVPRLNYAPIAKELVGLRPHRDIVRVDKERIDQLRVVHNYGHGSYGVTTAPGTAQAVVHLVRESLSCNSKM